MEIKLEQFEGPLELLLQLVEQEKLSPTEIALAEVTDQYLSVINTQEIDAARLADFLLIASRLLLIKTKVLLPFLPLSPEEEQEIKQLTFSLQEYQRYKRQAPVIKSLWLQKRRCFGRVLWQGRSQYFFPPQELSVAKLGETYAQLLASLAAFIMPHEERLLERAITLEQKISQIIDRIRDGVARGLREITGSQADKMDLILCFLAVLFLFRQKVVTLEQSSYESELIIKTISNRG